jgi:hypothetical protein
MSSKLKVLFICKKRKSSGPGPYSNLMSSGLLNSASFVNNMLVKNGINSKIVEVIDNNQIDKEVTEFRPTHVIIEALWVVPSKFEVLQKLHPFVKWIIRLHSDIPFLANEGIAMEWLYQYEKYNNVYISVNSKRILRELNNLLSKPVIYLPNYYPISKSKEKELSEPGIINIGCFGAVRPLKNQLIQAISAIQFAEEECLKLRFHVNGTRIENNGDPVLKNLRNLFLNNPKHELVEHTWMSHEDFTNLISTMDISMQVSFNETYNIVSADAVNNLVPVVVSDEIKWVLGLFKTSTVDSKKIVKKLRFTYYTSNLGLERINKFLLDWNSDKSETTWIKYFMKEFICETCCFSDCQCELGC